MTDRMNRKALLYLVALLAALSTSDSATSAIGLYITGDILWSSVNVIAALFWFSLTVSSFCSARKTKGRCVWS